MFANKHSDFDNTTPRTKDKPQSVVEHLVEHLVDAARLQL